MGKITFELAPVKPVVYNLGKPTESIRYEFPTVGVSVPDNQYEKAYKNLREKPKKVMQCIGCDGCVANKKHKENYGTSLPLYAESWVPEGESFVWIDFICLAATNYIWSFGKSGAEVRLSQLPCAKKHTISIKL
jgi:hypothetical protein